MRSASVLPLHCRITNRPLLAHNCSFFFFFFFFFLTTMSIHQSTTRGAAKPKVPHHLGTTLRLTLSSLSCAEDGATTPASVDLLSCCMALRKPLGAMLGR